MSDDLEQALVLSNEHLTTVRQNQPRVALRRTRRDANEEGGTDDVNQRVRRDAKAVLGNDVLSLDDLPDHLWQETPFSDCSATCGIGSYVFCSSLREVYSRLTYTCIALTADATYDAEL